MVVTRKEIAAKRALIDAIEIGDTRAVCKHLDNGGDVNATDKDDADGSQHSLLILAICQHQFEVAKQLIERGADVSTVYMNYDAMHACIYRISAHKAATIIYDKSLDSTVGEILKLIEDELIKTKGKEKRIMPANLPAANLLPAQVLIDAVSEGDAECINLLLNYGMDINIVYKDNTNKQQSVLIFAIFVNQLETARMLIEKGAELDTIFQNCDSNNQIYEITALQTARECMAREQTQTIEQLVELISNELMKRMGKQPRIVEPSSRATFRPDSRMSGNTIKVNDSPIEDVSMEDMGSRQSLQRKASRPTVDGEEGVTKSAACICL
ncbi:uncharacterized protein [Antedon mediterranea]|uniref:uncharacterized protein n=1 Tax=Antedon mediterranea TaxID=105859 RepID=UPI003AF64B6F